MLFRDAHAGMAEQDRNLIDRNAGKHHFDGESIAERVAVAALRCTVRLAEIGNLEETAVVEPLAVSNGPHERGGNGEDEVQQVFDVIQGSIAAAGGEVCGGLFEEDGRRGSQPKASACATDLYRP